MTRQSFWQKYQTPIEAVLVFILAASVRLTSLNVFRAIDEEDRWAWAVDFYRALLAGDLSATLVGDGYPGIFPVWLETIWLLLASIYRSILQGGWFGETGVYLLIHEWDRTAYLGMQRFPVVLFNTLLVVGIFLYARKLFGREVALLSAILISLDPFYLSDSRVNRAEALLTGLMTISLLALIAAHRVPSRRHLLVSACFGGLALLTKSQAVVLLPMFGVISFIWHLRSEERWSRALWRSIITLGSWIAVAAITFILLWPATWTVPGPTFTRMFNYATRKVGEEGVKIFFLGRTVLDEDPGLIFYPVIFLLRSTPAMLLGLLLGGWLLTRQTWKGSLGQWRSWLDDEGVWALIVYVLLYVGGMSLGSHKQDRFLMATFPALNILAAYAFVYLVKWKMWPQRRVWAAVGVILAFQLVTALPFHPYYFSYFNPLVGGGPMAVRLTRIGWGEGMDQVGAYLQSQEDAESLVVASRFYRYLLGFKGQKINLSGDGKWLQADKIVFYIQQSQRMLDPSPGVIRYFENHIPPEKVITIDLIDYAKIYQNPIQFPADPQLDTIEGSLRLLGYRWHSDPEGSNRIRLIWENLSETSDPIGVRLWAGSNRHGDWLPCSVIPAFEASARTPGEVVESECSLDANGQPAGLYDLQIGVRHSDTSWQTLEFASGWSAIELTADGGMKRVSPETAFARLADEALPPSAAGLDHIYADHVRLLAYEIEPNPARPGQTLQISLYWQAVRHLEEDAHVSLQIFGGEDERIALANGPPLNGERPIDSWNPGEVIRDVWTVQVPAETPAPALLRLDVGLFLPDTLTPVPVRNSAGEAIPAAVGRLRLEPDQWPAYRGDTPLTFTFDNAIGLLGYETASGPENDQLEVTLYWNSLAAPEESFTAFLHLIRSDGILVAQSDVPPAQGFFPTIAWQPGDVVLSRHQLQIPEAAATYTLLAGMYRAADGERLSVLDANNKSVPENAAPIGQIILP